MKAHSSSLQMNSKPRKKKKIVMKINCFFKKSIGILLMTALVMASLPCAALADDITTDQALTEETSGQTSEDETAEPSENDGTTEQIGSDQTTEQTSTEETTGQTSEDETAEPSENGGTTEQTGSDQTTEQTSTEETTGQTSTDEITGQTETNAAKEETGSGSHAVSGNTESYIVTIPSDQTLTPDMATTGTVTVSECCLADGQSLSVTVRSANGYQLTDASGTSGISYTVTPENGTAFSGTGENIVLTIGSSTTGSASAELTFLTTTEDVQQAALAARHQDTLTFTVSVN